MIILLQFCQEGMQEFKVVNRVSYGEKQMEQTGFLTLLRKFLHISWIPSYYYRRGVVDEGNVYTFESVIVKEVSDCWCPSGGER